MLRRLWLQFSEQSFKRGRIFGGDIGLGPSPLILAIGVKTIGKLL